MYKNTDFFSDSLTVNIVPFSLAFVSNLLTIYGLATGNMQAFAEYVRAQLAQFSRGKYWEKMTNLKKFGHMVTD